MPTRLTLQDIRKIRDVHSLARVFRVLGYDVDDHITSFDPKEVGFSGVRAERVDKVGMIWHKDSTFILHILTQDLESKNTRSIAQDFIDRPGEFLLIFTDSNFLRLIFAKPVMRRGSYQPNHVKIEPLKPSAHDLHILNQLRVAPDDDASTIRTKHYEALRDRRISHDHQSDIDKEIQDYPEDQRWESLKSLTSILDTDKVDEEGNRKLAKHNDLSDFYDYLSEIRKIPLLSQTEEIAFAQRVQEGGQAGNQLAKELRLKVKELKKLLRDQIHRHSYGQSVLETRITDVLSGETREGLVGKSSTALNHLFLRALDGELARQSFATHNLRLVVDQARKHFQRGLDVFHVVQAGNQGLLRAVDKFDYTKGYKFSTYATWWIRQSIGREIANYAHTIRLPVHLQEDIRKIEKARSNLLLEGIDEPTDEELVKKLGEAWTAERVADRLAYAEQETLSLVGGEAVEEALENVFFDYPSPFDFAVRGQFYERLEEVFSKLKEREVYILELRYGLKGNSVHTLEEVGAKLGVTRERVRQLENKAKKKLKYFESKKQSLFNFRDYDFPDAPSY